MKQSDIKIPEILTMLEELKKQNIPIELEEWTMQELTRKLIKIYQNNSKETM